MKNKYKIYLENWELGEKTSLISKCSSEAKMKMVIKEMECEGVH
jgi:hypothetical protein